MLEEKLRNVNINKHEENPFHLVDVSPWPICMAWAIFSGALSFLVWVGEFWEDNGIFCCPKKYEPFALFVFVLIQWFSNIVIESTYEGNHTRSVREGIRFGMILFIISELCFFASFFWAYYHLSLGNTGVFVGYWLPAYVRPVHYWGSPVANTLLLLASGVTITCSHEYLITRSVYNYPLIRLRIIMGIWSKPYMDCVFLIECYWYDLFWTFFTNICWFMFNIKGAVISYKLTYEFFITKQLSFWCDRGNLIKFFIKQVLTKYKPYKIYFSTKPVEYPTSETALVTLWLINTIFLGVLFLLIQREEYCDSVLRFNDSVFGSIFYILTGFHGLHVIIGVIFLIVCLFRQICNHFSRRLHVGYELAIWYWHMVDFVWLLLYFEIYVTPFTG